jgi:polysaccharide pyruvyl transferase CsaB
VTKSAILVGYYGAGNLGDEAIRQAIEQGAAARGWRIDHVAVRRDLDDPRAVRFRRSPLAYLRAIARANLVVLGGGGILKDEGLGLPLELLATTLAARILRRPVAILAVGVGPFYSRVGRGLVALTARLATSRSVRDGDSLATLRSMGVEATVVADPVFSLAAVPAPEGRAADDPAGRTLLICVRPWFHNAGHNPASMTRLVEALTAAVEDALRAEWRVRLVSLYWPRDHELAVELARRAGGRVEVDDAPLSWEELLAAVAQSEAVLTMRFHGLVAAIVQRRPAIAIAYEPKVAALAELQGTARVDPSSPNLETDLREALAAVLGRSGVLDDPRAPDRIAHLRASAEAGLDLAFGRRAA